jgi:serine protease Do
MKTRILFTTLFLVVASLLVSACAPAFSVAAPLVEELQTLAEETANAGQDAGTVKVVEVQTNNEERSAPQIDIDNGGLSAYQDALMALYEKVNPSIVSIRVLVDASSLTEQISPFELPEDQQTPDMPYGAGEGSGFVWDKEGHIVTNNHVVENAVKIQVMFSDGSIADAELVGADADNDLAVVKVNVPADQLVPVSVANSDEVSVGQLAIAMGNPFSQANTMTTGIVSALQRSLPTGDGLTPGFSIPNMIQTDAAINPGNSGGALVDIDGSLIGVPTAIESPIGANSGIGFAIPSNTVSRVVPVLIEKGSYEDAWLGISAGTLTPDLASAMSLPEDTRGVLVSEVVAGSPAEAAGLQGSTQEATIDGIQTTVGGDVIIAMDGNEIKDMDSVIAYLSTLTVGQKVALTILRDGKEQTVDVTLAARPATLSQAESANPLPSPDQQSPEQQSPDNEQQQPEQTSRPRLGISGLEITPDLATALDLPVEEGVLIIEVVPGSPAEQAGLKAGTESFDLNGQEIMVGGDIIAAIDGTPVTSVESLRETLRQYVPNATLVLTILRNGIKQPVTIQLGE